MSINSFQGILILHNSISGKYQLIRPKYAPYYHPQNALVPDWNSGYDGR